jgi:hypothetical protein
MGNTILQISSETVQLLRAFVTNTAKSTVLVLLPSLGADRSGSVEDVLRVILSLDLLQGGIVLAEEVLLPLRLPKIGL